MRLLLNEKIINVLIEKHGIIPDLDTYLSLTDVNYEPTQSDYNKIDAIERNAAKLGLLDKLINAASIHIWGRDNRITHMDKLKWREIWIKDTKNRITKGGKLNKNSANWLKNQIKNDIGESFTNPQKKNAEDLAKTVLDWYDFDTNYIDDGGQRRAAETKNKNTVEWFDEHPIEIKQKAYAIMKSKVHSSDTGKLQREFEKHLKESVNEGKKDDLIDAIKAIKSWVEDERNPKKFAGLLDNIDYAMRLAITLKKSKIESVNEGKDDFVARYGNANIILKKGYKHHNSDDLEKLYDKIGSLVKGLKVKDVNVIFESLNEVNVTRIPNLNLESDAYIAMLDLLKNNAKFKSIVSVQAEDLYSGGRTTNVFNILRGQLSKIMTPQIILSVIQKINSKRMILSVDTDDVNKGIHNDRFAGILALGIVDSLIGDPLDLKLIKDLGNAKVAKLAQEYSVNRGKQKFSSIIGNIKF